MSIKLRPFQCDSKLDFGVATIMGALSFVCAALLCLILGFLLYESWSLVADGRWLSFFSQTGWYPLEGLFGMTPMIFASLVLTFGSLVIALPVGLACAIFLEFYAKGWVKKSFQSLLNLLAGIPSVVLGLWGLTELVPLIGQIKAPGTSVLAGAVVLSLMILPTLALTSYAALTSVDRSILAGAQALGLTQKTQILAIAVPAARSGIMSGVLLASARALGETMVVLMVAGNVVQMPSSLFAPVRALTANIALEMAYALGDHRASLYVSGLLLTIIVWILAYLASYLFNKGRTVSHD
ncbi:phosphate ABC transporter permease subunit PstC [Sessilibacter sp. MAH2]